jgi:hypothetical protein
MMSDATARLSNRDIVRETLHAFAGQAINARMFRRIKEAVEYRTGRKCWCDLGLNPPQVTSRGIVRVAFLEPDYTVLVAQIGPGERFFSPLN